MNSPSRTAIAGRQECITDLGPGRDRHPKARYPKTSGKSIPFLPVRLQAGRLKHHANRGLLRRTSGTHFENGAKRCTLPESGNNLTEENPPTCPYKRTLRSSSDGTRLWKLKLPKPARIRRSTIFRSLS